MEPDKGGFERIRKPPLAASGSEPATNQSKLAFCPTWQGANTEVHLEDCWRQNPRGDRAMYKAYDLGPARVSSGSGSEIRSLSGTSDVPGQSGSPPPVRNVPLSDIHCAPSAALGPTATLRLFIPLASSPAVHHTAEPAPVSALPSWRGDTSGGPLEALPEFRRSRTSWR